MIKQYNDLKKSKNEKERHLKKWNDHSTMGNEID